MIEKSENLTINNQVETGFDLEDRNIEKNQIK